MVVEVRSPGDETFDKFDFYHSHQVEEILVADPAERELSLFVRESRQGYRQARASDVLAVEVSHIAHEMTWR